MVRCGVNPETAEVAFQYLRFFMEERPGVSATYAALRNWEAGFQRCDSEARRRLADSYPKDSETACPGY